MYVKVITMILSFTFMCVNSGFARPPCIDSHLHPLLQHCFPCSAGDSSEAAVNPLGSCQRSPRHQEFLVFDIYTQVKLKCESGACLSKTKVLNWKSLRSHSSVNQHVSEMHKPTNAAYSKLCHQHSRNTLSAN